MAFMDMNKPSKPFISVSRCQIQRRSILTGKRLLECVILGGLAVFVLISCSQDPNLALKKLRDRGVEFNEVSFVERAGNGDALVVKLFLQAGMNVNAKDSKGRTPLWAAAAAGHADVVRLLIEYNAAVNAPTMNITPIMVASKNGQTEVVKLLAAKGGKSRFIVSPEGVISDSLLNVEWFVGPDRDISWEQAQVWVSSLKVAGGGWRLPTRKELPTLYIQGWGKRNMDPAFKTTGWGIWTGEATDDITACLCYLFEGDLGFGSRDSSKDARAFAVRSRK